MVRTTVRGVWFVADGFNHDLVYLTHDRTELNVLRQTRRVYLRHSRAVKAMIYTCGGESDPAA